MKPPHREDKPVGLGLAVPPSLGSTRLPLGQVLPSNPTLVHQISAQLIPKQVWYHTWLEEVYPSVRARPLFSQSFRRVRIFAAHNRSYSVQAFA